MTELPYSLWQHYTIKNSHYNGLSLHITTNKKNPSFLFVLTSIVCVQNTTQFVYNTEQYKFVQVILVMTNEWICEWLLTIAETISKPHCFLPIQDTTVLTLLYTCVEILATSYQITSWYMVQGLITLMLLYLYLQSWNYTHNRVLCVYASYKQLYYQIISK
jgi:hypothetical protein